MLSTGASNDPDERSASADRRQRVTGKMPSIDLNCDMGEGMETDAAIFPFISSANIACGYHAGDANTMRRTVELALQHRVAIGAHPSYPDRDHFGRIDLLDTTLSPEEIPGMVVDQLILLQAICDEFGVRLHHVKPHGALYNRAAKDAVISALICRAIREFDPSLLLYGLSGSQLKREADRHELAFVSEVFADRTYREDGSLTPRTEPDALIEDPEQAARQVLKMVGEGKVSISSGHAANKPAEDASSQNLREIPLLAETICLHGDGSHAIQFARLIYTTLSEKEIVIRAPARPF
ncbi:MAG TPA: 5-oxoprolinase subunit PxpA [Puia sp.]|nr:5-oxoprolinase subunit PxpA [Puia sp.]